MSRRPQLLALDLDGTLLDPTGALRDPVRDSVWRARDAGMQVVVCTGRRYRTARRVLEALELTGPAVVHNGVVVKEAATGATLHRLALAPDVYRSALEILLPHGPPLVYVDRGQGEVDFVTEARRPPHPFQSEYVEDQRAHVEHRDSLEDLDPSEVVMLSFMADAESLRALRPRIEEALGRAVRTHFLMNKNYRGHILETVPGAAGKWAGLLEVAGRLGIGPEEIAAIGDDENDAEMIAGAGLGIAMGNAVPAVRAAAAWTTGSNEEDGVVAAIEGLLRL